METCIACYEGWIPSFVERELDRLYGTLQASLWKLQAGGEADNASTYVHLVADEPAVIILYCLEGTTVRVLTEVISLDAAEIRRFGNFIFGRYPTVSAILYRAVETCLSDLGMPYYARHFHTDVVLDTLVPPERYLQTLGKSVRRNLRRNAARVRQDFPDFECCFYEGKEFKDEEVLALLAFSRANVEAKRMAWNYNAEDVRAILQAARHLGLVCIARINGKVCGGMICYRLGDSYAFKTIAYDPAYRAYSLGFLLYYETVLECLRQGARSLNFGWNVYDYKLWLNGRPRHHYRLVLYRSAIHCIRDAPAILADWCSFQWANLRERERAARRRPGSWAFRLYEPIRRLRHKPENRIV